MRASRSSQGRAVPSPIGAKVLLVAARAMLAPPWGERKAKEMPESARPGLKSKGFQAWTALEGRIFTSLGFQPQAGRGTDRRHRPPMAAPPPHLGLKPQAGEYPPFQGGQRCV